MEAAVSNNNKTVLVIDDEITNITALTVILRSEYTVYSEDCGKDGIIAAEKYVPDIILLDVIMPEMDGYEVISALKNSEKTKHIPVIFISSLDTYIDEELGLKLGAVDYISKPFSAAIVRHRIRNQMQFLTDLTEIKQAHEELERRDILLNAVNKAANVLLTAQDDETFTATIQKGMEIIGTYINGDCVEIWQNEYKDGKLYAVLKHYWYSEKGKEVKYNPTANIFSYSITPDWDNRLIRGESIKGPVCDLSPEDQEFLSSFAVKSVLVLPVFIHDNFWGICCIDDCYSERSFPDEQIDILRSGTLMLVNAFNRNEQANELRKMMNITEYRAKLLYAVNRAAAFLLNSDIDSFDSNLYQSMRVMTESINAHRMYIWKNYEADGRLCCKQVYEWSGGAYSQMDKEFVRGIPYSDNIPRWETKFLKNECINTIVDDAPPEEQEFLRPQDIVSLLVVPVFVNDQLWGFVGFDDCHNKRIFTEEEESILRSGSLLFANAWLRNEMVLNIRETSVQLETAFEQANAASRAKSDFLSTMSHEMRTPMNAIIGMTSIGKKAQDIEQKNRALIKIEDASSHLLGVINDVLDMAKIEANKLELAPVDFNFEKMLQKVIAVVNFRVDEKKQELTVNIDKNIPRFIFADEQRLAQVITNLVSNAVKFTPEYGKIRLDAFSNGEADGNFELRIEIADSGIGISSEQKEKLFHAFGQADSGISRKFGGTGLGLTISKRIIELMGGNIWVESEAGKGAKFIFTAKTMCSKRNGDCYNDDNGNANINEDTECSVFDLSGKKVLVAEDIDINREILLALLGNSGLEIDCAENGEDAFNMIKASPDKYDIIFMDMQMPKMDGLEATRQIRTLPGRPNSIPILAMTANVFKDDIDACIAAGMNDHLGKPLDVDRVFEMMRKYLNPINRM